MWGLLSGVMRFIPYVGPIIAAICPLAVAFASQPDWGLFLGVIAIIAIMELITNNILEPWLYGNSTGMGSLAVLLSAAFWTAIWGPAGLILSMPLSICLSTFGRHFHSMAAFDILLGSSPALPMATRLYQRLLASDVAESQRMARQHVSEHGWAHFCDNVALPALALSRYQANDRCDAVHRISVTQTMGQLLDALDAENASGQVNASDAATIWCMGMQSEADHLAARMLCHSLKGKQQQAMHTTLNAIRTDRVQSPPPQVIILVGFASPHPKLMEVMVTRIRRVYPDCEIIVNHPQSVDAPLSTMDVSTADLRHTQSLNFQELTLMLSPVPTGQAPETHPSPTASLNQPILQSVIRQVAVGG